MDQDDHRAGGFPHDLVDQLERVLGTFAEPDKRDVGSLPGGHRTDVLDIDLARDHLVSQRRPRSERPEPAILALVRDQDTQMLGLAITHHGSRQADSNRGQRISGLPSVLLLARVYGGRSLASNIGGRAPAPTLGRQWRVDPRRVSAERERQEPSMLHLHTDPGDQRSGLVATLCGPSRRLFSARPRPRSQTRPPVDRGPLGGGGARPHL